VSGRGVVVLEVWRCGEAGQADPGAAQGEQRETETRLSQGRARTVAVAEALEAIARSGGWAAEAAERRVWESEV
jgi:hypothetical protein